MTIFLNGNIAGVGHNGVDFFRMSKDHHMPVHGAVMVRLHRADAIPAQAVAVQFLADRRKKRVNQVIAGVAHGGPVPFGIRMTVLCCGVVF